MSYYFIGNGSGVRHDDRGWAIGDVGVVIYLSDDEMVALVKVWCAENGIPFPWAGCVPEHDEIKAAEQEQK